MQVLDNPTDLPIGSHALSFHADSGEAEKHAIQFLSGAPADTPAVYFVHDEETSAHYNDRLSSELPARVGCVRALGHEQVESVDGKLRPVREVRAFFSQHHEGVTAGGDTLSRYLLPETISAHIEYEGWFDEQPREGSRFICPYDLRRLPAESAPEILRELGRRHSHVVLSSSAEPAVRLLQVFLFETRAEVPERLRADLRWASHKGYLEPDHSNSPLRLSALGRDVVDEWSDRTTVDW